jgi:hypothetical protein
MASRPGRPRGGGKTGGRTAGVPNRITRDVKALAQDYTERAIQVLAEIMETSAHDACRVVAARELLDRAWGRPVQPLANDRDNPVSTGVITIFRLPDNGRDRQEDSENDGGVLQ